MSTGYVFVEQSWWGWLIAGYLFLGGLAGAVMAISYYYWRRERSKIMALMGGLSAFLAIVVGLGLLLLDLGRPRDVMALFTSPRLNLGSWMTIGTYIISLFTVASGVFVFFHLPFTGLAGRQKYRGIVDGVGAVAAGLGIATAIYTGFLLAAARGIEFWNTPLMPVLFLASAASCGFCFYCAVIAPILYVFKREALEGEDAVRMRLSLQRMDLYAMLFELFLLFALIDVAYWAGPGAEYSAHRIIAGDLAGQFWIGVVGAGLVVPILVLGFYTLRRRVESSRVVLVSAIAGWLVLVGALLLRHIILASGVIAVPFY